MESDTEFRRRIQNTYDELVVEFGEPFIIRLINDVEKRLVAERG